MSANLTTIFTASPSREIEYLLGITFPAITPLYYGTSELVKNSITYSSRIEGVGEIRQTIENPLDRVNVELGNKDLFFDTHTATNFTEWTRAEAVLYRRYFNLDKTLSADVEVFRGGVEQTSASDSGYGFAFQIIPDTRNKGTIVADRTLNPPCSFVFKDPQTCAYVGTGLFCDHHLKSDCSKYLNTHHFGGTEHRYTTKPLAPGSPGNPGLDPPPSSGGGSGGGSEEPGGGGSCPALDQYVLAVSESGETYAKAVYLLAENDLLLNPLTGDAERVISAEIIENENLFEVVFANNAITKASATHPLIRFAEDADGLGIHSQKRGDICVTWNTLGIVDSDIISITPMGKGSVMKIKTIGPTHIYASGASETRMVVCHNSRKISLEVF